MWFALGFGSACALGAYGLLERWILVAAVVLVGISAFFGRDSQNCRRMAVLFLGCMVGCIWFARFSSFYLSEPEYLHGRKETVTVRISGYSEKTDYGMAADGILMLSGKPYQVRTFLDEGEPLMPGYEVTGLFRFRVTTPEGDMESQYHQGKGVFLLLYQENSVIVSKTERRWYEFSAVLRYHIREILHAFFPENTVAFAQALLIGDTSEIDYGLDTDLKISGIRHVVAVSGLHVSILFALISTITFRKRFLTALLGFPGLVLFAAVAGFSPSVNRACLMSGLMLMALLVNQGYDGPTALSFAALVMLLGNPLVITSASFQLSVGSVAGIYLFDPGIRKWILSYFGEVKGKSLRTFAANWFASSVSITLSAMTISTPLCAWYFGLVSLVGVVTNLLALWVISFIFYGIMTVCLLALWWQTGALWVAKMVSLPIRYVLWVAETMADVPMAAVYTCSPYIVGWLVFVYALLAVFLISRNRKPVLLSCCAVLGLCLALLVSWAEPLLDDVRITVLDVGQGQCILLQTEGKTWMVDCGGDSDTEAANIAAETLLSQGIARLDGLILTHLDRDHAGGAENLLKRMDCDVLILPAEYSGGKLETDGKVIYARENVDILFGEGKIQIFAPTYPGTGNEKSLCVLFDTEKCDILITGDRNGFGERMLLRSADIPDVDVLIAGHHGSKNSTCEELLAAVLPEIVCISAGEDNSYGHPAPKLLERLAEFGCTVYRTDQNGSIIIRR